MLTVNVRKWMKAGFLSLCQSLQICSCVHRQHAKSKRSTFGEMFSLYSVCSPVRPRFLCFRPLDITREGHLRFEPQQAKNKRIWPPSLRFTLKIYFNALSCLILQVSYMNWLSALIRQSKWAEVTARFSSFRRPNRTASAALTAASESNGISIKVRLEKWSGSVKTDWTSYSSGCDLFLD